MPNGGDGRKRGASSQAAASDAAKQSRKENRVYVGNLSFQVRWNDLKDFMREAGDVAFAEVMTLPNGVSKGCGVVEYKTAEGAQRAIQELNEKVLLGRPLFIREDREEEARFGQGAPPRRDRSRDDYTDEPPRRSDRSRAGAFGAFAGSSNARAAPSKQLYVGGLNWEVGWQDLKDLFRQAGDIVRADTHTGSDGNPKGSGTVVFANASDAQHAISMFDGAELNGMKLEVREERFTVPSGGPFAGGSSSRSSRPSYSDRPDRSERFERPERTERRPFRESRIEGQPSNQIFVKNLPWSTTNDDLVDLFQTVGQVAFAEVIWEGGRSKGVGVIQFASQDDAELAMTKFQGYGYGGRDLNIAFNARYRDFAAHPVQNNDPNARDGA